MHLEKHEESGVQINWIEECGHCSVKRLGCQENAEFARIKKILDFVSTGSYEIHGITSLWLKKPELRLSRALRALPTSLGWNFGIRSEKSSSLLFEDDPNLDSSFKPRAMPVQLRGKPWCERPRRLWWSSDSSVPCCEMGS